MQMLMINCHTALVVGASRGIGLAIAQQLLQEPGIQRVYATYRQSDTAEGLLAIDDERLQTLRVDVTSAEDLQGLATNIRANQDHLDFVINSAGILHEDTLQPEKALDQCKQEALIRVFQVNSIGPLMLARAVLPLLPKNRPGHFAVLSAMVGSIGDNRLGGWYGYRASKAALNHLAIYGKKWMMRWTPPSIAPASQCATLVLADHTACMSLSHLRKRRRPHED